MSCSDMMSAYKNLPVKISQRRLQVFQFCGRQFVDLRLIFGDKVACLLYDRFHHCVVVHFVLSLAPIPRSWIGRTIEGLSTICPPAAADLTKQFVAQYRTSLEELNIKAAPEDPERIKAFDASTTGEVLGIWFDTEKMTWRLHQHKAKIRVNLLLEAIKPEARLYCLYTTFRPCMGN